MTTFINPYLNFNGKCKEAMSFYRDCLGGELMLQKVSESPMAAQIPSQKESQILHSVLTYNNIVLMGSDMVGENLQSGNNVSICLNCGSEDEVNTLFDKLANGGKVITPLHQSFWGATYGELQDKYGVNWMFNLNKTL